MKNLLRQTWFKGALILILWVIIFLLNLWIMSLKLNSNYDDETVMSLARQIMEPDFIIVYGFVLTVAFFMSLVPILLSGIGYLKKNNLGFSTTIIYTLIFELALISFQLFFSLLSVFSIILIIINILLTIGASILFIMRSRALNVNKELEKIKESDLSTTKMPLFVFIMNIVSILILMTVFFIPIFALAETFQPENVILIRVLFLGDPKIEHNAYFLAYFAIFLGSLGYLAKSLSLYYFNKDKFVQKSGRFINFIFIMTISFFMIGLAKDMYYTYVDYPDYVIHNYQFIPMLLMLAVIFTYSIIKGKYKAFSPEVERKTIKYYKGEPLIYVILLTAVTILMLLLPVVKIDITSGAYEHDINLTGFEILRDYASLDQGYNVVAYLIVVMFITVGLSLIITLTSYLSKYKNMASIIKFTTGVNVFFVFIFAISGYYFQIAKAINQAIIYDLAAFYGVVLPDAVNFDYIVGTQTIYALIASVAILILMFARKVFDREDLTEPSLEPVQIESVAETESKDQSPSFEPEEVHVFDPCPSFTDLDSRIESFQKELERRKSYRVNETSLNELVHFVVDYAKNSRLHLSYTPEDIATFVSGLGASRLSILQGMSGTGKTSLPKIFSEAILGNCDIIEVESSWKDKNELLGYYNEFSMKYTPKKFTLALYKAALNPEITTFILLDEMNLSRIEYYFSDFLSLMENEENMREIKLINIKLARTDKEETEEYKALDNGNTLRVPPNIWFIGTANRDESTFVISDKVYDRAHTMNFTKRAPKVRNYTNPIAQTYYDYKTLSDLFNTAKQKGNFDAENNELIKHVEALLAPYNISFGNRILKQIEDFVNIYKACFPNEDVESEAIESILLSKVVAKLEVKTIEDKEKLEMDFIKLNLHECASFIKRLDNE